MPNLSHAERGFWQRLADRGEAAALVGTEGQVVTYAALAARAAAWSERLGSTRRLVVLQVDHDVDRISAYLGALVGGHPVAIVGSDHAAASLVATYDPDVVIGPAADGTTTCTVRRSGSRHRLHPDLAVLLSTSGSTGSPKLVRLSHRNLAANAAAIAQYLALTPADRAQTTLPLHYCYGLSVLHSHLTVGGSVVLNDASVVDPCFWRRFSRTRATGPSGAGSCSSCTGRPRRPPGWPTSRPRPRSTSRRASADPSPAAPSRSPIPTRRGSASWCTAGPT
jgi:acyl-CoA synthetase (AMP-forming)/AMP-acid ligase II